MKPLIAFLLIIIAACVGYLAYSQYQERAKVEQLVQVIADPDGYLVKRWEERANLKCEYGITNVVTRQAPAGPMAQGFTCRSSTGNWTFVERRCTDAEIDSRRESASKGAPTKIGDVYRPMTMLCWEVTGKE